MRIRTNLIWVFTPITIGLLLYLAAYQVSLKTAFVVSFTLATLMISILFRVVRVEGHQRLIISRGGQYLDPGVQGGRALLLRFLDRPIWVDMRPQTEEIENEFCYTREGASLTVNGLFLWQVLDPVRLYRDGPSDLRKTLVAKSVSALQSTISTMSLDDVVQERERLNRVMAHALKVPDEWGIRVYSAEVRDVRLHSEVEVARNRQVAAERNKEAAAIEAQGAAEAFRAFERALGREEALEMYKLGVLSKGTWFWSPLDSLDNKKEMVSMRK